MHCSLVDKELGEDDTSLHRAKRDVVPAVPGSLNVVNKFARYAEVMRIVLFNAHI